MRIHCLALTFGLVVGISSLTGRAEAEANFGLPKQYAVFGQRGGSRILAKNEEETKSHEISEPLTQKVALTAKEQPLIEDISLLSDLLADVVKRGNPRVHELYTKFRKYGLER